MAVLINDFEIVLDPPAAETPPESGEPAAAPAAAAPTQLRPADVMSVAMHVARRKERVRAH